MSENYIDKVDVKGTEYSIKDSDAIHPDYEGNLNINGTITSNDKEVALKENVDALEIEVEKKLSKTVG